MSRASRSSRSLNREAEGTEAMQHVMDDVRAADLRSARQPKGRPLPWPGVLQTLLIVVSAVQICRCAGKPWRSESVV